MRTTIPDIEVPVTVFVGSKSRVYPPEGQLYFKKLLPHAEVVPFDNSGHALTVDQPLKFAKELKRFLDKPADEAMVS
tara:strand:- start:552 stop:782 length:231 start_codon:yes stop_codon:yes gene_type:complete